ncbi:hypothetical protein PanWU01x14_013090 [Parasponia andersonii]|uniref:Uncharacterized protein n=1 Tax=Parasponia andersonii TaxID=3476 RepID=A0A2P5E0X8_PARAD|nr:hypothetical protein PanWU01x14_013090 [Parasponia andersonii]
MEHHRAVKTIVLITVLWFIIRSIIVQAQKPSTQIFRTSFDGLQLVARLRPRPFGKWKFSTKKIPKECDEKCRCNDYKYESERRICMVECKRECQGNPYPSYKSRRG